MPNRLAQVRTERGWKKTRLIYELRRAASRRGETLPKDESLGRRIAVWENQDGAVSDFYRELLCEVYGREPVDLGLLEPPRVEEIPELPDELTGLPELVRLDSGLVALLRDQTQGLRLLGRRLGGPTIHAQAVAHVETVQRLVRHALPGADREVAADELGQAAALAGWQALDMGRLDDAWRLHETATAAAREGGAAGLGYARAQQGFVLLDAGRVADAHALIRSARERLDAPVSRELRAWLHAAEGEALAALGDRDAALHALDSAAAELPDRPEGSLPYLMLDQGNLARWRGHCLARLGETSAIEDLSDALDVIAGDRRGSAEASVRAEIGLRVDLAIALRARGEVTESQGQAARASELAGRTGSARQRRRIEALLSA